MMCDLNRFCKVHIIYSLLVSASLVDMLLLLCRTPNRILSARTLKGKRYTSEWKFSVAIES